MADGCQMDSDLMRAARIGLTSNVVVLVVREITFANDFDGLPLGLAAHDFGILKWPTLAVCFGPPLDTTNFYSGFEHELGSGGWGWTGEPRWSCSSRFEVEVCC